MPNAELCRNRPRQEVGEVLPVGGHELRTEESTGEPIRIDPQQAALCHLDDRPSLPRVRRCPITNSTPRPTRLWYDSPTIPRDGDEKVTVSGVLRAKHWSSSLTALYPAMRPSSEASCRTGRLPFTSPTKYQGAPSTRNVLRSKDGMPPPSDTPTLSIPSDARLGRRPIAYESRIHAQRGP